MEVIQNGITSLQNHVREALDIQEKRNLIASVVAGILFFTGWWIIIDVGAIYTSSQFHRAFYIFGILGTISFIIVNSISNSQFRDDGLSDSDPKIAKGCILIGFTLGFTSLMGALWVLIAEYASGEYPYVWPGIALMLHNMLIFFGSLTFKFGRVEEQ